MPSRRRGISRRTSIRPTGRSMSGYEKTKRAALWLAVPVVAVTIVLGITAVFMGVVYNYVNSKSLAIEFGSSVVFILAAIALPRSAISRMAASKITLAAGFFLLVAAAASLLGKDPVLSWFGHLERGTGMFFLVVASAGAAASVAITRHLGVFREAVLYPIAVGSGIIGFSTVIGYTGFGISRMVVLGLSSGGGGFTGNSSFAGTVLMVGFLVVATLWFGAKRPWERPVLAILGLATLVNPVVFGHGFFHGGFSSVADIFGDAHGATASLVLGIAVSVAVFVSYSSRRIVARAGRLAAALMIALSAALLVLAMIPGTPVRRSFVSAVGEPRAIYWDMSLGSFAEHPLFGTGLETFRYAHERFFDSRLVDLGEPWADKPHNAFLELLVTTGAAGFACYGVLVASMAMRLRRMGFDRSHRPQAAVLSGLLFAYLLNNAILFDTPSSLFLFMLIVFWIASETVSGDTESVPDRTDGSVLTAVRTVSVLLAVAILLSVVVPQAKKLKLVWDSLFAPVSERIGSYAGIEDISPYGAGISFAQRADRYGQNYLGAFSTTRQAALADIDSISDALDSVMARYPKNIQEWIAMAQLEQARVRISGIPDARAVSRIERAGLEITAASPGHPKGKEFLLDAKEMQARFR